MKVLVVGGGGREHALAWSLARSDRVSEVIVAPGNAGTALEGSVRNAPVGAEDIDGLLQLAQAEQVSLTVVGPEAALVAGIVDRFETAGMRCFGPRQAAARLEGSKSFTKDFMERHGIPTAGYRSFTEADSAIAWVEQNGTPIVIKADGLAAGKGVVVAHDLDEARTAIREMLEEEKFGNAGAQIVVEEFLEGEEASFIAIVDGENILPLASSQDHKARDDGDTGPNTGGMGAYSPAPVLNEAVTQRVMETVMRPTVEGLAAEGCPYTGFLYAGLMIDAEGNPRVLEFNCRFGDPETQPILLRLRSDFADLLEKALDGSLSDAQVEWDDRAALGVVMAAGGYPENYAKGHVISGLPESDGPDSKVFHAGTRLQDQEIVTSGGRVLCVVGLGQTVTQAQRKAYDVVETINWQGSFYRRDIGHRALAREA